LEPGTLILLVGAILLAAVVAAAIAGKAGVPVLVAFLGLGMLLGSDGVGGIDFSDAHLARTVGIIGLAIILFEGGITTPWRAIRPVVVPAAVLATVGVVITAAITGVVAHAVFPLDWPASFLLGAVVASTDAAAVFSTLRVTSVRRRLARVLEAESGTNDPIAVALTIGLIQWVEDRSYGLPDLLGLIGRTGGSLGDRPFTGSRRAVRACGHVGGRRDRLRPRRRGGR
jgi:cell volume regulation protein A